MISCSGASVKDPHTGRTSARGAAPRIRWRTNSWSRGEAGGHTVIYYHRDHLYIAARNHWTELYESRVGERADLAAHATCVNSDGEAAEKIVWYGEPDALGRVAPGLQSEYRDDLTILSTDPENLEFLAPAANKADALAAVARSYYGITQADTLSFGDGENDAPMLRWAGLGVAVDGANDTAKSAARLVGPPGVPEERFARALGAVFGR